MILWTFQPIEIWETLQQDGVYRCDPERLDPDFVRSYDWLAEQMRKRIGPPPEGVQYPVWAWHTQKWKHEKPDLRRERWCYGPGNELYACIEIEIPDGQVLLSDFEEWHCVLNDFLVSDNEEEYEKQKEFFDSLPEDAQKEYKEKNWERIFNTSALINDWIIRGEWIQATFWELRKEQIRRVRFFRTACAKF